MDNAKQQFTNAFTELDNREQHFTSSLLLDNHPLRNAKKDVKALYYAALGYFVSRFTNDADFTDARLEQYRSLLIDADLGIEINDINRDSAVLLLCDLALILLDETTILQAGELLKSFLSDRQSVLLAEMIQALFEDETIQTTCSFAYDQIMQYRKNRKFANHKERRYIVTANVSAGKSTLINALVGRAVARTSMEACTTHLSYIFNKPFDDGEIHLIPPLNLSANYDDIKIANGETRFASYFNSLAPNCGRICIIDTPGVNYAIDRQHGETTRKALQDERYDMVLFILNATQLGTDEEMRHLKWVSENVPKDKVMFVINKLDTFKSGEDNINFSIQGVRNDLFSLGFENPPLCPLSAYFANLIKLRRSETDMSEDEFEDYKFFVKKFSKAEFDLSGYYPRTTASDMSVKCGIYGLEQILFGGEVYEKSIH
jgi:GTP-binding protein EngB required for normal cell division